MTVPTITDDVLAEVVADFTEIIERGSEDSERVKGLRVSHVRALLAERAELKRDAERYRWLRKYENDCFMLNTLQVASMEDLDVAIDAAMQEQPS